MLRSFFVPKLCNQCDNPPCVQVCPVGATFKTEDGVVLVDEDYCIGCRYCIQACPYGARYLDPHTKTADKCTFCYHRITKGLLPACVEVCPTQARVFGELGPRSSPLHRMKRKKQPAGAQAGAEHRAQGVLLRPRRGGALNVTSIWSTGLELWRGSRNQVTGYIYPNEVELHWGLLVVIYPYITGLVAGAFILASLEKVFGSRRSSRPTGWRCSRRWPS